MFFFKNKKQKYSNNELNQFYEDVEKLMDDKKQQILNELDNKYQQKFTELEKIIKPEINLLYIIIKILEEKEILSEEELDTIFKEVDREDFDKMSQLYKIYIEKEKVKKKVKKDEGEEEQKDEEKK